MQDAFLYASFTASDGTVLPYRYYLPAGYGSGEKRYPVFFYLHGNGSRGSDNTTQLRYYSINTAVYNSGCDCIMIAPQCKERPEEWTLNDSIGVNTYPGSRAYAAFLASGKPYGSRYFCAAVELLDSFLKDAHVDTSRVYLAGGSNGAGAVWNLMTLYPEVFAGAIPVAGSRAEPDYVHAIAHRMKNIPIWAFQGDSDNNIFPEGTRVLIDALRRVGGRITYTEVEGGTHGNIWKIAADTPGVVDWLFSQKNDAFVNTLSGEKGTPLAAPAHLRREGDRLLWDEVPGAGAYAVTFYANNAPVGTRCTPDLACTLPDFAEESGATAFGVRAYPQNNAHDLGAASDLCRL